MCGIAGFIAAENIAPLDEGVLRGMLDVLRYRGPDDVGVYLDRAAALGHARLSIIDLAGGHQPMHNEDRSLWIVFNGEIFNYRELRAELIERNHSFATSSDTEVILHLFEDYGEACVSRLNGQWAFAIWDSRKRRLFLSRDRLGVRPLFYTWVGEKFLFASEIKALFACRDVTRELDVEALNQVFTFWHTLPPRTAFRGIRQLPPGHSATIASGKIVVTPYWDLDYTSTEACPNGNGAESRYAEELMAVVEDATRIRLRADVPVGAYLSGGLDSTLITALIRRSGVSRLKTFSVRFPASDVDEGAFQHEAVQYLGTDHQHILCDNDAIRQVFPNVIWHAETPLVRSAPAPMYLLSRLVRENGYKVVLTGEGSDELLGGYDIFKEVKIRSFWATQPSSRLRPLLLKRLYPYMPQLQSQPPAYLQAFFHIRPEDTGSPFFSHLPRWRLTSRLKHLFSDAVQAELARHDPIQDIARLLPAQYYRWDSFTRAQYLEARYLLPGYILSSQGDRVAMAHSVEGRFPFLDYRVAEFACRLPSHLKMKVLKEKYLLKRCGEGLVPPGVLRRSKQPYRAPEAHWLLSGIKADGLEELISPGRIRRDGIFSPTAVQKLFEKAQRQNITSTADNMAIVAVLSTQLLIDRFITHFPSPPPVASHVRFDESARANQLQKA